MWRFAKCFDIRLMLHMLFLVIVYHQELAVLSEAVFAACSWVLGLEGRNIPVDGCCTSLSIIFWFSRLGTSLTWYFVRICL